MGAPGEMPPNSSSDEDDDSDDDDDIQPHGLIPAEPMRRRKKDDEEDPAQVQLPSECVYNAPAVSLCCLHACDRSGSSNAIFNSILHSWRSQDVTVQCGCHSHVCISSSQVATVKGKGGKSGKSPVWGNPQVVQPSGGAALGWCSPQLVQPSVGAAVNFSFVACRLPRI